MTSARRGIRLSMLVACISLLVAMTRLVTWSSDIKHVKKAVPYEFIVQWVPGTSMSQMQQSVHQAGGKLKHIHKSGADGLVFLPTLEAESLMEGDLSVTAVIPNMTMNPVEETLAFWPDAKICQDCGGGPPPSQQVIPLVVSRVGAQPGNVAYTGSGVGVAVLDTGVQYNHRDFTRTNGTQVISSGCWHEDPYWLGCGDSAPFSGGHGTAVAGIIAAADNTVDVVGIAPGATVYDFNVNMYNPSVCYPYNSCINEDFVIDALEWIIEHQSLTPPIKVINMSFGRPLSPAGGDPVLESKLATLNSLHVISVTAAGNDPTTQVFNNVPANSPNVLAIASTTAREGASLGECSVMPHVAQDSASWYTTDGAYQAGTKTGVSISAPGEDQENMVVGGTCSNATSIQCLTASDCPSSPPGAVCGEPTACRPTHIGTNVLSTSGTTMIAAGTSIASPVVAGVVALMEERAASTGVTLDLDTVRSQVRTSAILQAQVPYDSPYCGPPPNHIPCVNGYTYDGEREGIVFAPWALQQ